MKKRSRALAAWMVLQATSDEQINKAFSFYLNSPDGQYDLLAAEALSLVLAIRKDHREDITGML